MRKMRSAAYISAFFIMASSASLLVASAPERVTFRKGFRCSYDLRPVDGNLHEITLINTSRGARKNSYHVIYRNVSIHGNQHDTESKFVLATDLSCKFSFHDKRVVLCERDPVADESSRSSFTSSLKDKQGADGQQQKVLEFNVSSPELAAAGKIPNNLSRKKGSFKTVIDISQCISLEARS